MFKLILQVHVITANEDSWPLHNLPISHSIRKRTAPSTSIPPRRYSIYISLNEAKLSDLRFNRPYPRGKECLCQVY